MKVEVAQKHIDEATKLLQNNKTVLRSMYCPIALAVKDLFPACGIVVGYELAVSGTHATSLYDLPSDATIFIRNFDNGLRVGPLTFEAPFREVRPT